MNLSKKALSLSLMAATILFFSGCNKLYDYIKHHPGGIDDNCRVMKISHTAQYYTFTMDFHYNEAGNPTFVDVTPSNTGNGDRTFSYDKKNRLIEQYAGSEDYFDWWIHYYYDKHGRISHDTGYYVGFKMPDGTISTSSKRATVYDYDQYGRIIKTTAKELLYEQSTPDVRIYEYDKNGNLKEPNTTYDNKMNIRRTHKLWMFLDRNYSVNNPFTAAAYNKQGLPVKTYTAPDQRPYFLWSYFFQADVTYQCKN